MSTSKRPNAVANEHGDIVGFVTHWNSVGIGECIVQYFDGSADSAYFKELNFPNGERAAREYLDSKEL